MKARAILPLVGIGLSTISYSTFATNPVLRFQSGINTVDATSIASPIFLGYSPFNSDLVVSGSYSSGSPKNFYTIPNGGSSFSAFSSVNGITDEVPLAVAAASLNGFSAGEVFANSENLASGWIMRISPSGATSPSPYGLQWFNLGEDFAEGGIFFDTSFNSTYRLYVATPNANVFRIASNGTSQQILSGSLGGFSASFSAVVTITNDTPYGAWAGKVLATDETGAFVYIASPNSLNSYTAVSLNWNNGNGSVTHIFPEDMVVIPQGKNFYFVDYGNTRLIQFSQGEFTSFAGLGKVILATEFPNTVVYNGGSHTTHFWTIRANAQMSGGIEIEPLLVVDTATNTELSSQIEKCIFVPH